MRQDLPTCLLVYHVRVNDSYGEGTAWGEGKGQLLMIPVWKWFCNWKPLVALPHYSRTVYTVRPREQLVNPTKMLCLRFSYSLLCDFTDFINVSTDWLIADGWIKSWNESNSWPVPAISSTCTERLLYSYLINGPTAVWVFVFVCIWTANTDVREPKPQNTKLLHNVADNYHDNIHSLKGETRQRGWSRNTATLRKSIKRGRFSPMGYGLLVWSIPV